MLNVLSGDALTIVVPFKVDGEYVSPDANSVSYDVRDNDGDKVVDAQSVAVTSPATEVAITISGLINTKTKDLEQRTLVVRYTVGAKPYTQVVSYRVINWINTYITTSEVRSKLGVTYSELPDEDIDLFKAHYSLTYSQGSTFTTALTAGDITTVNANDALLYRAILDSLPALSLKLRSVEAEGGVRAERLKDFNIDSLREQYVTLLSEAIAGLSTSTNEQYSLPFAFTARTDPVTNA